MENTKREIKFRIFSEGKMLEVVKLDLEGSIRAYVEEFTFVRNPKNLMQFTGLLDKNGKECFEGDIVKNHNGYLKTIEWEDGGFVIKGKTKTDFDCGDTIEVIGNIYETPELLK